MTFILAANHREATAIARKRRLKAGEWQYVATGVELEGLKNPIIIATECWRYVGSIERYLRADRCLKNLNMLYGTEPIIEECR